VPTLRHHTPENRPFDEFLAASCESRARKSLWFMIQHHYCPEFSERAA
jgi:hypothetical protein